MSAKVLEEDFALLVVHGLNQLKLRLKKQALKVLLASWLL